MKIWLSNFCTVRWLLIVLGLRYLQLRQFATATLSKMALPLALTGAEAGQRRRWDMH